MDVKDASSGAVLVANQAHFDFQGNYTVGIPNLVPGTYRVTAKGIHWLGQTVSNVSITASGASVVSFILLNGDVNGDDTVSLADFGKLKLAYGTRKGDADFNPNADLNGDGVVDDTDFKILEKNYGQSGS